MGTQLQERLPRSFRVWVGAATVSQIGDGILYFALGWTASAYGGVAAGAVLAALIVPRTLLMLLGGAIADRVGARPVLIAADVVVLVASAVVAVAAAAVGGPLWLLLVVAVVLGIATAFAFPAAGSLPARLVDAPQLPRALALRNAGFQVAQLAGAPLGGLLVVAGGLVAALGVNAVSFVPVVVATMLLHANPAGPAGRASLLREMGDALRVAVRVPALRVVLAAYAVAGGFVLPVQALLVPLLARERGWAATDAGLVEGAVGAAALLCALVVARTGTSRLAGPAAGLGLLGTAVGAGVIAAVPAAPVAIGAGLLLGAGLGVFIAHAGPVLMTASPASHLSRIQALLGVVQSGVMVGSNLLLGWLAGTGGAATATLAAAAVLAIAAVLTGTSRPLR
ncbi:MFS transporter [Pseudonocardia sp. TRM90224]|uniref:MFS transporter n=1 Tax=Pseudonocardia sp. TRM90224 TaxID=2812678 RepID=UPI001E3A5A3B|nr:MFS transporter [Pseudonocardia sp. TRM90224]